jgi:hypothetical protein
MHPQNGGGWDHEVQEEEEDYRRHPDHHSEHDEDEDDDIRQPVQPKPRGKPEAMAAKLASAARLSEKLDESESGKEEAEVVAQPLDDSMEVDTGAEADAVVSEAVTPAPQPKKKKKKSPTPKKKKEAPNSSIPTMEDPVKPITGVEYENLEALMVQFCRVPLLAEFSRPVALLHPEVSDSFAFLSSIFLSQRSDFFSS